VHNDALEGARTLFLDKETGIRSLIQNESRLTPESKTTTLQFVGTFFDLLRDEDRFQADIVTACRN
jgi:hypothetical protein